MDFRKPLLILAAGLLAACPGDDNNVAAPVDMASGAADMGAPDSAADDMGPDVEPDMPAEPGSLQVEPTQLTFEDVRVDETDTQIVAITNVGGSPLVVTNVMLTEFNRMGEPEFVPGTNWDESFVVGAGLFRELEVTYAPHDFAVDEGELTLFTNDPDNQIVQVRLNTVNSYMDIEAPPFLRFGEVAVGDELTKRITLYNRGVDPLTISDISISGVSNAFFIEFDPNDPIPTVLERDEDFVMDVRYAPLDTETDRGTVTITSDDPDEGTVDIPLTGNDPTPCLDINPPSVDLGELAPGTTGMQQVTLLNCSQSLPVSVSTIELADDGGEAFTIANVPDLPVDLSPLQTVQFDVSGTLPEVGTATGEVTIESTDAKNSGVLPLRLNAVQP